MLRGDARRETCFWNTRGWHGGSDDIGRRPQFLAYSNVREERWTIKFSQFMFCAFKFCFVVEREKAKYTKGLKRWNAGTHGSLAKLMIKTQWVMRIMELSTKVGIH